MKIFAKNKRIKPNGKKQVSMFHLAWPIFVESILMMLVGNMDQYMVSNHSENAVGSIGNANQIMNLLLIMFTIISVATTILVSQYIGAKNTEKLSTIYTLSITINLVFGLVIAGIVSLFSKQIFSFMSLPEEFMLDAVTYIRIVGGFIFLQGLMSTFSAILRANKMMKENLIVSVGVNLLNMGFNAILINGLGPIPALGVAGAAIATNISRIGGVLLYIYIFVKRFDSKISLKYLKPFPKVELRKMLSVGIPAAGESISYSFAMTIITKIVNMIGLVHGAYIINTRVLAKTFSWVSFLYASAVGQAAQVVIGNHMGAGEADEVDKIVKKTLRNSVFIGLGISLTMFIFSDFLFGLFSSDPMVLALGKKIMLIEVFLELGKCTNITLVRSLQATGDVKFPTMIGIIFMWAIAVGLSYILGVTFGLGLVGVWIAMALDEEIRGVIFMIRWKKGGWKNIRLVESKE